MVKERFKNPENWQKNINSKGDDLSLEKLRPDVSDSLGKPLTLLEDRCYKLICLNNTKPISNFNLYSLLYGQNPFLDNWKGSIRAAISRIRGKLGTTSIITIQEEG